MFSASIQGTTDLSRQSSNQKESASRKSALIPFTNQHLRQFSAQLKGDPPRGPKAERTRNAEAFLKDPENLAILQTHQSKSLQPNRQAPPIPRNPLSRSLTASAQGHNSRFQGARRIDRYRPPTDGHRPSIDSYRPSNGVRAASPDHARTIEKLHELCRERKYNDPKYGISQDRPGLWSGLVTVGGRVFTSEQRCTSFRAAKAKVAHTALNGLEKDKVLGSRIDKSKATVRDWYKFRTSMLKNWTIRRNFPDPEYSTEPDPADDRRVFGLVRVAYKDFRSEASFASERDALASAACIALGWFCQPDGTAFWKQKQADQRQKLAGRQREEADLGAADWKIEKERRMSLPHNIVKNEQHHGASMPPPPKKLGPWVRKTEPTVVAAEGKF